MKKWEQFLVSGAFGIIIGVVLLWTFQAIEPIEVTVYTHENIFGEKIFDSVETDIDAFFVIPLVLGMILIGCGIGEIAAVWELRKLEKRIEGLEPKVATKPKEEGKLFCRYCGKENKSDAVYCERCGKKV